MPTEAATIAARHAMTSSRPGRRYTIKSTHVSPKTATGLYESPSVQDRIRQWQMHGAASAPAPDAVSVRSIPASECPSVASRPHSESADARSIRAGGRSKERTDVDPVEARSRSTPRKRIVSDGHWKAKDKMDRDFHRQATRERTQSRRYDLSYISNSDRARDRRRSQPRGDLSVDGTPPRSSRSPLPQPSGFDDGIRVTGIPTEQARHPPDDDQSPAYDDAESNADEELARRLRTPSTKSAGYDRFSDVSFDPQDEDTRQPRASKYIESLGRPIPTPLPLDGVRSKKGGLFQKTREMFARNDMAGAMDNRLPSIEAWLDEQPDPFVDDVAPVAQDDLPPVQMPLPLKKRSHRRRVSVEPAPVADPNKIWESIQSSPRTAPSAAAGHEVSPQNQGTPSSLGSRNSISHRRTSSHHRHHDSEASPSSLRRRGARVRRQRESPSKVEEEEEVVNDAEQDPLTQVLAELESINPRAKPHSRSPRPPPPTAGHQLSTIASVETFKELPRVPSYEENAVDTACGLKRRMTTHEDMMSVLSLPRQSRRQSRRQRSSRRARNAANSIEESASTQEVLKSLMTDEEKYSRELRTLVDGVIPVLLQNVLSKSDAAATVGLFTSLGIGAGNAEEGITFTKPIIDMGIALERLKSLHNRIPVHSTDNLLNWAQTAQKAYAEYLSAWRLGFDDVVPNLALLEDTKEADQYMDRDEQGDLITSDGRKVDVAYLLKRPLVRLKTLSKTFATIEKVSDVPLAHKVAQTYADLTTTAKRRIQEEQARLEDEAAANVDATRARDLRTLAPANTVHVDKTHRVKARDFFTMTLFHTSGERMDCGVELVFRESAHGDPAGGDVLILDVEETAKWLLFPPVARSAISARRGEDDFNLVVLIRGPAAFGKEWHELLALKTDDLETVSEWMAMLGSNPLPPRLNRTSSIVKVKALPAPPTDDKEQISHPAQEPGSDLQLQAEVDIPLGEPSLLGVRSHVSKATTPIQPVSEKPLPKLNLGGGLAPKAAPSYTFRPIQSSHAVPQSTPSLLSVDRSTVSTLPSKTSTERPWVAAKHRSRESEAANAEEKSNSPQPLQLQDRRSKPISLTDKSSHTTPTGPYTGINQGLRGVDSDAKDHTNPLVPYSRTQTQSRSVDSSPVREYPASTQQTSSTPGLPAPETTPSRPEYKRVTSSTPTRDLPTVQKIRASLDPSSPPHKQPGERSLHDEPSGRPHSLQHMLKGSHRRNQSESQVYTEDVPLPPQHITRPTRPLSQSFADSASPPAPPLHKEPVALQPRSDNIQGPISRPTSDPVDKTAKRKPSSPLKHEYAPSSASDSSSNYESDHASDTSSETSEGLTAERGDQATPLVAIRPADRRIPKFGLPPSSVPTTGTRTLAPSDSASQGPYRKVPSSSSVPQDKQSRAIALICAWSDKGSWEPVHPDECSILISPGLIEAFEMSAAHSNWRQSSQLPHNLDSQGSSPQEQPVVAFELTPLVPLRRGTGLDISFRSPPTANSKIRTTNNIMFRSRNTQECDALYAMINWARCNNPTYIQLEAARMHRQPSVRFNTGPDSNARSKTTSWFSFGSQKQSSYRASSAPTPASVDMSVQSSGTTMSRFSALKRLGVSSAFNLNRSSVHRKNGVGKMASSLYSASNGTGTSSGSSTPAPSQMGFVPGKDGPNVPSTSAAAADGGGMINNMKIRFHRKKGQYWEDLGAARLSVLPAVIPTTDSGNTTPTGVRSMSLANRSPDATPPQSRVPSNIGNLVVNRGPRLASANHTPHRVHGNGREKRILIVKNKERDVVLLDAVLGESCFERVMQCGVGIKVWTEDDQVADKGGVTMGRATTYIMHFNGVREAGWVFGLCGSYRYGNAE